MPQGVPFMNSTKRSIDAIWSRRKSVRNGLEAKISNLKKLHRGTLMRLPTLPIFNSALRGYQTVLIRVALGLLAFLSAASAQGFCGFFAGKADASLFNEASQVVLA